MKAAYFTKLTLPGTLGIFLLFSLNLQANDTVLIEAPLECETSRPEKAAAPVEEADCDDGTCEITAKEEETKTTQPETEPDCCKCERGKGHCTNMRWSSHCGNGSGKGWATNRNYSGSYRNYRSRCR